MIESYNGPTLIDDTKVEPTGVMAVAVNGVIAANAYYLVNVNMAANANATFNVNISSESK